MASPRASVLQSLGTDLEAGPHDAEGGDTHMRSISPGQSGTKGNDTRTSAVSTDRDNLHRDNPQEQVEHRQSENPQQNDGNQVQGEATHDAPPVNSPPDGSSDLETPMIGDFEGSANAFWTLFGKEAKSHDEATIKTLKEDMDGVLIFAGLFSAAVTAFIIDSKQHLQVNPQDQMVYYLQQNVALLDQISRQISSIAPQFSIPSTSQPPFTFNPSTSDVLVNAFWFMSLVFSLTSALLATLVQQWVRDYMNVFQRYSDPLKSARLRQYLHEGWKGWYMPVVAEAVPGLLHVSLFLFFVGLCDFVLNINTAVGLSTTVPIAITGSLYICTAVSRIFKPQSPYKNSFSGLIWYMIQKFGGRRYKDRDSIGTLKFVSPDMAEGQMQLAMEETKDRKGRDERSIRWLVSHMTEDAEIESLVMAIPGSFDDKWGLEVWKKVSSSEETKNDSGIQRIIGLVIRLVRHSSIKRIVDSAIRLVRPSNIKRIVDSVIRSVRPSSIKRIVGSVIRRVRPRTAGDPQADTAMPTPREKTVHELSTRVGHLFDTCKNPGLLASNELWRKRTRACIEATASLVCCAGAELGQFGDVAKLLGDIGEDQNVREASSVGKDQSLVMRWTCLSLMAIRPILESNRSLHDDARLASQRFGRRDSTGEEQTRAEKIIGTLEKASGCLEKLSEALVWGGVPTEERVQEIFSKHEPEISTLEKIDIGNVGFQMDDWSINSVQNFIDQITHKVITHQLPGVQSDSYDTSASFSQFVELFRDPHALLFIFPLRNLKRIRTFAHTLRDYLEGHRDVKTFQEMIKNLQEFGSLSKQWDKLMHRQMWRLQDLSGGGGLGFTVELFFIALKQLLSTSSNESHSDLYVGTFHAITSDWSKYKGSLETRQLLLDMVVPHRGIIFSFDYPDHIVDRFLLFLGDVLEGDEGPHINDVVQGLTAVPAYSRHHLLSGKVLDVIRERASLP